LAVTDIYAGLNAILSRDWIESARQRKQLAAALSAFDERRDQPSTSFQNQLRSGVHP
jgi:hypothetical protein